MSWDAFTDAVLLIIFLSFFVERSLAVLFETRFFVKYLGPHRIKPTLATMLSMLLIFLADINLLLVFQDAKDTSFIWDMKKNGFFIQNIFAIFLSGLAIAGGSKASIKLLQEVLQIKSRFEANRYKNISAVPAKPIEASVAAASGDSQAEELLNNLFEQSGFREKYPDK